MELVRIQSTRVIAELIVTMAAEDGHTWGSAQLAKRLSPEPGNPSSTNDASASGGSASFKEASNDDEKVAIKASNAVEGEHRVGGSCYHWVIIIIIIHHSSNYLYKSQHLQAYEPSYSFRRLRMLAFAVKAEVVDTFTVISLVVIDDVHDLILQPISSMFSNDASFIQLHYLQRCSYADSNYKLYLCVATTCHKNLMTGLRNCWLQQSSNSHLQPGF